MLSYTDITGVILAGGKGSRMGGQDKGLLAWDGRPLVEHLLEALRPQTGAILINANRNHARYQAYGYPVVADDLEDFQGPLAGFATAMRVATTPYVMTVPCDGPEVVPDMATRLLAGLRDGQAELAVAHDGERLQPVHALVPVSLLPSLEAFMAEGNRKIELWYTRHRVAQVDFTDCTAMFRNINTPRQHALLQASQPASKPPPVVGFCAWSGTGKTTLLVGVIPFLKAAGLRLSVIKHGHHQLELDTPGKDSYRFREAGADQVLLASRKRLAVMQECQSQHEPELQDVLRFVHPHCADLVLVEGFKHTPYPKIEAYRPSLGKPCLYPEDPSVIAVATDAAIPGLPDHLVKLDINKPQEVAEFILEHFIRQPALQARRALRSADGTG